jgi:hypothetical protein
VIVDNEVFRQLLDRVAELERKLASIAERLTTEEAARMDVQRRTDGGPGSSAKASAESSTLPSRGLSSPLNAVYREPVPERRGH